jgi:hypothetical protein
MLHIYMKQRTKLPSVQRGACGAAATDLHGSLVGILVGVVSKKLRIEELLSEKVRKKLERGLSKAFGRTVLKTKFNCKRLEVSSILAMRGQIRSAITDHLRYLDHQRAEEERLAAR